MFLKTARKIPNIILEVLVLFSFTLARWATKGTWGYDETYETVEVAYFKWFFPLKNESMPPSFGKQTESVKKRKKKPVFEKNENLSEMLINLMAGHQGFQLTFYRTVLSVKRIKRTKRL